MPRLRMESAYLSRYLGSGVLNTAVGFAAILVLMRSGAPALLANAAGYALGLVLGFVSSKKLVFRTTAEYSRELVRYLAAFSLAFLANFALVGAALHFTRLNPYLVQLIGAGTYTTSMYLLSRYLVFRPSSGER